MMNKHIIFATTAILLACTNAYFYQSTQSLKNRIQVTQQTCQEKLAHLRAQAIQTTVSTNNETKATPAPNTSNKHTSVAKTVTPAVNLESMVSHGHRVQAVTNKYEFLLQSAQLAEQDKKRLQTLLTKRERLANAIAFAEQDPAADLMEMDAALFEVEDNIYLLLKDPLDYHRYEFLKARSL